MWDTRSLTRPLTEHATKVRSGVLIPTHRTQLPYSLRQCTMAYICCSGTQYSQGALSTCDVMNVYTTLRLEWHLSSKPLYTMSAVTQPYLIVKGVMRTCGETDMSDPPASYIVEQAHLQCSVYCVCPMLDVTQTSYLNYVHGTVHTVCTGFTHLLFAVQCQCASWCVPHS